VRLNNVLLGDLGHPRVDSRLVSAILLRGGDVALWLQGEGVDIADVQDAFPDARWPLDPPRDRPGADEPDPSDRMPSSIYGSRACFWVNSAAPTPTRAS
jgi:hypothetical protein